MKKLFFLILPVFVLGFLACSSDDGSNGDDPAAVSTLKMKINGTQWTADQAVIIGQAPDGEGAYGMTISGMASDGSRFTAAFSPGSGEIEPGTYTCGFHLVDGGAAFESGGITYLGGNSSETELITFVISEVRGSGTSRKFRGSFSGTMIGSDDSTIEITDGQFSSF